MGQAPVCWGQRALFTLEVDGVPYIVSHRPTGSIAWHDRGLCHRSRKSRVTLEGAATISASTVRASMTDGARGSLDDSALDALLGRTVVQYCVEQIPGALRREGCGSTAGAGRTAVEAGRPSTGCRRLGRGPVRADSRLSKAELEAVRPTESMVKRGVTHAEIHNALFQINLGSGIAANNKLADELLEQKLVAAKARNGFKLVKAGQGDRLEIYIAAMPPACGRGRSRRRRSPRQADRHAARITRAPAGPPATWSRRSNDRASRSAPANAASSRGCRATARPGRALAPRARDGPLVEAHWASVEAGPNPPAQEGLFDGERAPPAAAPIAADVEAIPDFLKVKNRRGNAKVAAQ
jgi:hypothetical protein